MKNSWLSFLYGESQINDELDGLSEDLNRIFEETETQDELVAKKTPLTTALKALNVDAGDLEMDADGFSLSMDDDVNYHKATTILNTPDNVEKLAEMGWVVTKCGDRGMTNEPPDYKIRFLEIATADAESTEGGGKQKMADIIKKGREFATTPLDRSAKGNPVTNSAPGKGSKHKGMSDASDGEKTPHAMHGYSEDAKTVAAQFLDDAPKRIQIEARSNQRKKDERAPS